MKAPLVLRFISGKYQGGEFPVPTDGEINIGRSSELDMVLVEDMVSRKHARIFVESGELFLEDLGSTNGSFVNGERITKAKISEGDRILIGTSIIKLIAADAAPSTVSEKQPSVAPDAPAEDTAMKRTSFGSTMTGSIAEVSLPDLLQLFSASKKSGLLVITTSDHEGKIYLHEGRIQYAVVDGDETVSAEKSFYRILVWETGTFDLMPPDSRELPEKLDLGIEALLMEGMRQIDEMRRLGPDLPKLNAKITIPTPLKVNLRDATPDQLDVIQLALNYPRLVDIMNHSGKGDPAVAEVIVELLKKGYLVAED